MLKDKKITVSGKRDRTDLKLEGRNENNEWVYSSTDDKYKDIAFIIREKNGRVSASYDPHRNTRNNLKHPYTEPQRGKK